MKKVLIVIPNMNGGGAEKVLLNTLRNLETDKYEIELKTFLGRGKYLDQIPEKIKVSCLFPDIPVSNDLIRQIYYSAFLRLLKIMPAFMQYLLLIHGKYDIEIAYLEGAATKLISGSWNRNSKKISWVHIDLKRFHYSQKAFLFSGSEKKAYRKYDLICCVSTDIKNSFDELFGQNIKTRVIHNVLDTEEIYLKSRKKIKDKLLREKGCLSFVCVGRLTRQKNLIMLLEAVYYAIQNGTHLKLNLIGEGEDREKLESFAEKYGLKDTVRFIGFQENPYPLMAEADILISSSIAEGFSTVVCESIILGRPVIVTDCGGMHDIISDSGCGIIVDPDRQQLQAAIEYVCKNPDKYAEMKVAAEKRGRYFSTKERIKEFEEILDA